MTRPLPPEPDFAALGGRFVRLLAEIMHAPERTWTTEADLYATVLRKLLAGVPSSGFITHRACVISRNSHTEVARMNAERAQAEARAARAETHRVMAEAAEDLVAGLSAWCNQVTVPSRYRREGVALAVHQLRQAAVRHAARAEKSGQ